MPVEAGDDVRDVRRWLLSDALAEPTPWDHAQIIREAGTWRDYPSSDPAKVDTERPQDMPGIDE
ncbi:MAG TPA: hypothetical protein VGL46_15170 [Pseudonocardiaceae bacterium]|jgi:hypothetical protein